MMLSWICCCADKPVYQLVYYELLTKKRGQVYVFFPMNKLTLRNQFRMFLKIRPSISLDRFAGEIIDIEDLETIEDRLAVCAECEHVQAGMCKSVGV